MKKGIVILFPGERGCEIPLLYFSAKKFTDIGYEKLFIQHPHITPINFHSIYANAMEVVSHIDFKEYEHIIFVGKSLGSVVAAKIKQDLGLNASLILLTPLKETLPYMNKDNSILLVAAGDQDKYLDSNQLQEVCIKEQLPYYIEHGVGHRMEVTNNLSGSLAVIDHVLSRLSSY